MDNRPLSHLAAPNRRSDRTNQGPTIPHISTNPPPLAPPHRPSSLSTTIPQLLLRISAYTRTLTALTTTCSTHNLHALCEAHLSVSMAITEDMAIAHEVYTALIKMKERDQVWADGMRLREAERRVVDLSLAVGDQLAALKRRKDKVAAFGPA